MDKEARAKEIMDLYNPLPDSDNDLDDFLDIEDYIERLLLEKEIFTAKEIRKAYVESELIPSGKTYTICNAIIHRAEKRLKELEEK